MSALPSESDMERRSYAPSPENAYGSRKAMNPFHRIVSDTTLRSPLLPDWLPDDARELRRQAIEHFMLGGKKQSRRQQG